MKAPGQPMSHVYFFRHLGGKIDTAYFVLRAGPGQKICCSLA